MKPQLRVIILYDNNAWRNDLVPDWGFSCWVEYNRQTILFDTGARPVILAANMKTLGIDPLGADFVFISHDHWDHTGGMALLQENKQLPVYVPTSLNTAAEHFRDMPHVTPIDHAQQLGDNVYSTGELKGIEHSLVVRLEDDEVALVVGCSHPGVREIVQAASAFGKVTTLIGGLHGFQDFELIKDLKCICPTHCTRHIREIAKIYPEKYIPGGAGKVIEC